MKRPVDIVRKIFPNAQADYVAAFDIGETQLNDAEIDAPLRLAHLLAQCYAETGGLTVKRESLHYTHANTLQAVFNHMSKTVPLFPGEVSLLLRQDRDLGERFYGVPLPSTLYKDLNHGTNPGNATKAGKLGNTRPGDGYLFRGNGLLQTTGGGAHKKAGDAVQVDFFNHPELVTAPEHALKAMLFEWTRSDCNEFADADDLLSVSRAINIGNAHSKGTPIGMKDRRDGLAMAKAALGI